MKILVAALTKLHFWRKINLTQRNILSMMSYRIDDIWRGRGIVSQLRVAERGFTVGGPYVGIGPTSPGALHDECGVHLALTDDERAVGDNPM